MVIGSVIESYVGSMQPLANVEPDLAGPRAEEVEDALRPIGAKVSPHFSPDQAEAWRKAMLLALSNLPTRVVIVAARKAIHDPFEFLSEVEPVIRRHAAEIHERHRTALKRLRAMEAEIQNALKPPQAQIAEAPPAPIPVDEIRTYSAAFVRMGLSAGFITQAQVDDAFPDGQPTETSFKIDTSDPPSRKSSDAIRSPISPEQHDLI